MTVQPTSTGQPPEITAQRLQALSFYLIVESLRIWKSYKEIGRSKATKINAAARIHDMITDAIRLHPDIQHLAELDEMAEQLEKSSREIREELDALRKVRSLKADAIKEPSSLHGVAK
ncbi:MAG: hypothetical protein WB661_09385 [Candidatus Bathyarchaeia archaeon]